MDYFKQLQRLLQVEQEEDRRSYRQLMETLPVADRRESGLTWYPIAIRETEIGRGDYLTVEVERTTHTDVLHQLRFGMSAALFSNHDPKADRVDGVITHISGNRLKISLRIEDLPDWTRNGKLGIDAVFDEASYQEMEAALKSASAIIDDKERGRMVQVLTGGQAPTFNNGINLPPISGLNPSQTEAVKNILTANELAIVHGPPGTGKTTTLVQAIRLLHRQDGAQVLVVAPSNAAVDLLSEKLSDVGLNVVRVGNPARVAEAQLALTLDRKMAAHQSFKEIKRLKKQAAEYRDMAQRYKRSFGRDEREQRKALFAEARNIARDVERTEQYIVEDVLSKAHVITATLVGANHYTVRHLKFQTVVIDEAAQALEPACWIPILKAKKVVMAGDHWQLPPTIKSDEAAKGGLATTLMEKCVALHPESVVLLQEQYRMHQTIMGFSSQEFYKNKLIAHPSVADHVLAPGDKPLLFIDTAGCGFEEKLESTSLSNEEEARFLVQQMVRFVGTLQPQIAAVVTPSIGVISPYRHQVELLKELAAKDEVLQSYPALSINTIDSFQGQERDAIFISMVRSNTEGVVGFLSDIRRMNVAMTRARKKLVVVGDSATLAQASFYADFIAYAQEHDAYQSAWELMEY
ncbi:AAA domain-containing protein [Paracnuella aquatica]|uniref:AAA domain-containing protein n=1 Tax=Paracnuella aquatica TaxID=2268757 RepID=UPI000DEF4B14|nr:AAA domain-containing protein [Paracnuella aquatica]RPD49176.1 IGHMBP2 family helicase [Paracnuella aquatica]